jgi:hypothetical protein
MKFPLSLVEFHGFGRILTTPCTRISGGRGAGGHAHGLSDAANEASDERVVEVVVSADDAPFLIGQRVLVKFMKPGQSAHAATTAAK